MHIMHLACAVDCLSSVLMDLVDEPNLISGNSRDKKLETLWINYRNWAEATGNLFQRTSLFLLILGHEKTWSVLF